MELADRLFLAGLLLGPPIVAGVIVALFGVPVITRGKRKAAFKLCFWMCTAVPLVGAAAVAPWRPQLSVYLLIGVLRFWPIFLLQAFLAVGLAMMFTRLRAWLTSYQFDNI